MFASRRTDDPADSVRLRLYRLLPARGRPGPVPRSPDPAPTQPPPPYRQPVPSPDPASDPFPSPEPAVASGPVVASEPTLGPGPLPGPEVPDPGPGLDSGLEPEPDSVQGLASPLPEFESASRVVRPGPARRPPTARPADAAAPPGRRVPAVDGRPAPDATPTVEIGRGDVLPARGSDAGEPPPVEVVDLDGASGSTGTGGDQSPAIDPPDRWLDRSAHLLGVRRALLDPGRRGVRALVLIAVVVVVAAGVVAWRLRPVADPVDPPSVPVAEQPDPSPSGGTELVVSVVGKVRHPGVVRVPAGSRVVDAVRAAGGALPGADLGMLNQARKLVDGEQIAVGVTPPPDTGAVGGPAASANPGAQINLNTATADQLDELPGVGPTLSGRIIAYRTEHGGFRSVEELKDVSGIGDARYADLKDLVTV